MKLGTTVTLGNIVTRTTESVPVAHPGYQVLLDILFRLQWPDSELLSHSAVLRLWRLELTLQSLSPVLTLYDPFGVDVPLNCDITIKQSELSQKER